MNNFFKHRLGLHFKEMTRYLKYVFNDFFVIALMFFIGALGLVYSNFLKEVVGGTLVGKSCYNLSFSNCFTNLWYGYLNKTA